jgi:hypothetical protein
MEKLRIVPGLWLCKGGYEAEVVGWSFTQSKWVGYLKIDAEWIRATWDTSGLEGGTIGIYALAELQVER